MLQTKPSDFSRQFLQFVQAQALAMRAQDVPPDDIEQWKAQRKNLHARLVNAIGGFPEQACPLEPRVVGKLKRDGYRVEKLLLQTRPGIQMTANAYVPMAAGKRPAVLCVHGHWKGAKQDPVVQSRCIGLAKLGFFVLAVDAFGAGERGLGKALGEYHGEMVAATLWPTGLALAGLQVYDNMRAVDYLQSRTEVNPDRIGITGTSGGGNQTMYAGAIDERFKCVVPVCSVGTYQAYLGAACCMCEVTPGALSFTEESSVLALVAPRGLMVINATRDAFQFSVGQAKKSIAGARPVFELYDRAQHIRHTVVDSKHDYNRPMREAMYGWMTWHLKDEGDGSPITEPDIKTELAELLRCFPGESRPDDFVTIPALAAAQARSIVKRRVTPNHLEHWQTEAMIMGAGLIDVLGGFPRESPMNARVSSVPDSNDTLLEFEPEPGINVFARHRLTTRKPLKQKKRGLAVVLDLDQGLASIDSELSATLVDQGWDLVTADVRAIGKTAYKNDKIGGAPDHNTAEWSMWIGRPLMGQWAWDVMRLLDCIDEHGGGLPDTVSVIGVGAAGTVALCAAAFDGRIDRVATIGSLSSYVTSVPYKGQRLGIMVPNILNRVGDISHLASLVAPRRLVIAGGVAADGRSLAADEMRTRFEVTRSAFQHLGAPQALRIVQETAAEAIVAALQSND